MKSTQLPLRKRVPLLSRFNPPDSMIKTLTRIAIAFTSTLGAAGAGGIPPHRSGAEAIAIIQQAIDAGERSVTLPTATYEFLPNQGVTLSGQHRFRLDGNGSTFLFNKKGKLSVSNSEGAVVENMTLDYHPLPFTQGVVVGVNPGENCIRVRFDTGYASPGDAAFPAKTGAEGKVRASLRFFDATGERVHASLWEAATAIREVEPSLYELALQHGRLFRPGVKPDSLKPGDRFALFTDSGSALEVKNCENATFREINIYSSPGFAIGELGGKGGNRFQNCRAIRKPGDNRLMGANRDGFHSYMTERGPSLRGCVVEYSADDAIAIHGFFTPVLRLSGPRRFLVLCPFGQNVNMDDDLPFYSVTDGKPLGQGRVTHLQILSDRDARRELAAWQTAHRETNGARLRGIPHDGYVVAEIQIDGDITLEDSMLVDSKAFSGAGAEIIQCHVHDISSRGLLVRAPGVKIKGNRIERTVLSPIALMPERYWLESSFLDGAEVTGNVIADAPLPALDTRHFDYGFAAIQVSSIFGSRSFNPPEFTPYTQNRKIRISGNQIIRPAGPAIAILNAEDVEITQNRMTAPFAAGIEGSPLNLLKTLAPSGPAVEPAQREVAAQPWYAILLMATHRVRLEGNTLSEASRDVRGTLGIGPWVREVQSGEEDVVKPE